MTHKLTAIIEHEGDGYVALCFELDIASQEDSIEQARNNLVEAWELFFENASPEEIGQRLHTERLTLDDPETSISVICLRCRAAGGSTASRSSTLPASTVDTAGRRTVASTDRFSCLCTRREPSCLPDFTWSIVSMLAD